ncbi:MAG: hypothetical protein IKY44_03530 [Clostridia bacterium]|nr:hypothetical protein [Clostridia bacterium]
MKIKRILFAAIALVLVLSCLAGCSKEEILNPETFGVEDFMDGHAKYTLGILKTDVEFVEYAGDCIVDSFCLPCNIPGNFNYVEGAETVKWQIKAVIMKSDWQKDEDAFLYPTPNGDNYPVFFIYTLDVDGNKTDYISRATQNPDKDNKWEVEFVMMPTPAQLEHITQTFDDNSWHVVTAQ